MRKLTAIILALVLALSVTAALADSTISVSGSGEVLIPADVAVVSLGVNARNAEAPRAQAEATEIIARIREALTAAGEGAEIPTGSTPAISTSMVYTTTAATVAARRSPATTPPPAWPSGSRTCPGWAK